MNERVEIPRWLYWLMIFNGLHVMFDDLARFPHGLHLLVQDLGRLF